MEPFSLEGEDLSYVITIMNNGNVVEDGVTVNTRYILSEPIGERDCSEYIFTIFSENSYSKSRNGITGRANIPTGRLSNLPLSLSYLPCFPPPPFPTFCHSISQVFLFSLFVHACILQVCNFAIKIICILACTMYMYMYDIDVVQCKLSWLLMRSCYHSSVLNLENM